MSNSSRLGKAQPFFYTQGMRLSPKAIQEFKEIWKAEFGEELSDTAAEEHGLRLLRLFKIITQPLPQMRDGSPQLPEQETFDKLPETRTMEEEST
jgi:hypothetical protein